MKIREIAEKIGDIDIKAPSKDSRKKFFVLTSVIYDLAFKGMLLVGVGFIIYSAIRYNDYLLCNKRDSSFCWTSMYKDYL